ncbi:MAG: flagellar hook-associated protein FlgK [Arcobacter sp.]|nr:flagellar hook-associated protein FlgK [Arcobacter sp.]
MIKSLNVAKSGLDAAKLSVENISNNIANENTPGYKKRVVQLSELELIDGRMTGRGVRADTAYRITSQYMYDNMMKENSKANYLNEISSITGNIETMFQESDQSGFSNDIDRYFQAIEDLRTNPNSEIYRTTFKNQGKVVVDSLQNLYSNIEKQEELTQISLSQNVQKINTLVNEIGSLNQQLGQHKLASNDLLDKRDQLEKELSEYVNIEVDRSNNEYTLKVGGAIAVRFNTNIRAIELVEDDTAQIDRFSIANENNDIFDQIKNVQAEDGTISSRTFLSGDIVNYKFNNEHEVSVTIGEAVYEADGVTQVDINNDGFLNAADNVDTSNLIRALAYKINHHSGMSESVTAYNGNYALDSDGNKVDNVGSDKFLLVESNLTGEESSFEGRISISRKEDNVYRNSSDIDGTDVVDSSNGTINVNYKGTDKIFNVTGGVTTYNDLAAAINADGDLNASIIQGRLVIDASDGVTPLTITDGLINKIGFESIDNETVVNNEYQSQEAENKMYLSVFDSEVKVSSGSIKAQIENLTTTSANNKLVDYKNKLDDFAGTLSDLYDKFVKTDLDEYEYGHVASDEYNGIEKIININLFSGSDVKSLQFNQNAVNDLVQSDLDYMAKIQWKKDIGFDGKAQDGKNIYATSFSEFYQEVRVNISSDKESNDFLLEAQETVQQSLQSSYDQLTKVDNDEEMVNLIKYQAAYTANAKIITVVDEMLQTLLGIK